MRHWIRSRVGAKLLTTFSLLLMLSMFSLNYVATKLVATFGTFSASRNEENLREHTYTFLSRITHEQTMRHDSSFAEAAADSLSLAKRAGHLLDDIASFGKMPLNLNERLSLGPNGVFANDPSDLTIVNYWGSPQLSSEVVKQLNALSQLDPFLQHGKEGNPNNIAAYVVTQSAIRRYYPNLATYNLPPPAEYDLRKENFYVAANPVNNPEHKTVWTEIYLGSGALMAAVSSPIYNRQGEFLGVTAIDVSLKNLVDDFTVKEKSNDPNIRQDMANMFSFLIDHKGRIVACPARHLNFFGLPRAPHTPPVLYDLFQSSNPDIKSLAQSMLGKESLISSFLLEGRPYVISSRTLPSTGWRLAVVVPESAILASVQETKEALKGTVDSITTKFALVTLSFLICTIVVAVVLSVKYIITPLKHLAEAASKVKAGDLKTHVDMSGEDEIGTLANSFNSMVEELRRGKELEKEYTRTLEEQVKNRTSRLRDKNRELGKALDFLQKEIAERKLVELALRTSEWKYRQLYENSRDGFATWDMNGMFLECNQAFEKMLGYTIEELRRMNHRQVTPVRWHAWEDKVAYGQIMAKGYSGVYEKEYTRKDGEILPVELSVHLIQDVDGQPIGMWAFARDIADRKRRVEELKIAKETAEAATRAKSLFLANMSHEIRTPMNAILGFAELLQEQMKDEQHRQFLASISSSGKTLLSLINDILDLSKIEAGKMEVHYNPVRPRTIVEEIQKIFSRSVAQKGLEFLMEIDPLLPEMLLLDEIRLRQILLNLVGNAVKFTKDGHISLAVYQTEREQNHVDITFSVEDTGIGIAEDQKQRIFEAFHQQEGQNSAAYGGTGLGLTITKRLVEMMGGEIAVESKTGRGSIFTVAIRDVEVAFTEPCASEEIAHEQIEFGKATILIADDIECNRNLLKSYLQFSQLNILEAENGREAIEFARLYRPDLILMDMKMPAVNGYEAVKILRSSENMTQTPVIAISASAMKEETERIKSAGCDAILSKPVTKKKLLNELKRFLQHSCSDTPDPVSSLGVEISPQTLDRIPDLISVLQDRMKPKWETIRQSFIINEIEDFGRTIEKLGHEYELAILARWGRDLCQQAINFDMEKLPRTLAYFPQLLDNITSLATPGSPLEVPGTSSEV